MATGLFLAQAIKHCPRQLPALEMDKSTLVCNLDVPSHFFGAGGFRYGWLAPNGHFSSFLTPCAGSGAHQSNSKSN